MKCAKNINLRSSRLFRNIAVGLAAAAFLLAAAASVAVRAQFLVEGFDNINTLPAAGWFVRNNSVPVGPTGWSQGNTGIFPAQAGATNSYISANFNNTTGTNTISNWLLTPNLTLHNGAVIKFWTREVVENPFPDRLEVRLSTNGASTNVGTGSTAVGDFTTVLLSINPNLTVNGYPQVWTEFTITLSGLPLGGTSGRVGFRYFVTGGGPTGDNSNYIGIDTFSYNAIFEPPFGDAPFDYDGDGRTDYAVVRNTGGGSNGQATWFIHNGTTHTQTPWGLASTDYIVSGDFDGDDKADITVYRPQTGNSFFYTLRSSDGAFMARQLGTIGDDPTIVGDYDGDDIDDYAVYRLAASPGLKTYWYYLGSATPGGGLTYFEWGQHNDFPAPGDYDGDGKMDFCVQRNNGGGEGVFHLSKSSGGTEAVFWGTPSDLVVPGDYDGDGKTDFAVVRGAGGQLLWSVVGRNNNNIIHLGQQWGLSATDLPAAGDYDGDGKMDIAVWRSSGDSQQNYFYVRRSSNGSLHAVEWGQQGDYPVAVSNAH
jgi:hypothetical protein